MQREHPLVELSLEEIAAILQPVVSCKPESLVVDQLPSRRNSNYRVTHDDGSLLVRAITSGLDQYAKEFNVCRRYSDALPLARCLHFELSSEAARHFPVAIHEWVEGTTLATLARENPDLMPSAAMAVGEVVAAMGNIKFDQCGFLTSQLTIAEPFQMSQAGFEEYTYDLMSESLAGERLGRKLCEKIWAHIQRESSIMDTVPSEGSLVHGDFHAENIIVQRDGSSCRVAAVLDWEFAMAWTPAFDLAQVIETPFSDGEAFATGAINAYMQANGWFPENWPVTRGLLQLLRWTDLLSRENTGTDLVASARDRINAIISA